MIDILGRRRKNNPICVGDPGVGKTAVVEGLALKIVEGDVPDFLKNVELLSLDMGMLQAGAGVKGEFENRAQRRHRRSQGFARSRLSCSSTKRIRWSARAARRAAATRPTS